MKPHNLHQIGAVQRLAAIQSAQDEVVRRLADGDITEREYSDGIVLLSKKRNEIERELLKAGRLRQANHNSMLYTTFNRIRASNPCKLHYKIGLRIAEKTKADDTIVPYCKIVQVCGLRAGIWAMKVEPKYSKEWRQFAKWCSEDALKYQGEHAIFAPSRAKQGDIDPDDDEFIGYVAGEVRRLLLEDDALVAEDGAVFRELVAGLDSFIEDDSIDEVYEAALFHEVVAGRAGKAGEAAEARKRKFLEIVGGEAVATM